MTPLEHVAAAELAAVHSQPVKEWHAPEGWSTPTLALMAAERLLPRLPVPQAEQEPIPGIDGWEVA
jgi:hypothetical protein